jgi:hypothetical protein
VAERFTWETVGPRFVDLVAQVAAGNRGNL